LACSCHADVSTFFKTKHTAPTLTSPDEADLVTEREGNINEKPFGKGEIKGQVSFFRPIGRTPENGRQGRKDRDGWLKFAPKKQICRGGSPVLGGENWKKDELEDEGNPRREDAKKNNLTPIEARGKKNKNS